MKFTYPSGAQPVQGYTIRRGLGRGGFGEVYLAVSEGGKEVALKWVQHHLDVELRGVGHCLNLKHPHLVDVYDILSADNDETWVVMEYIAGESLDQTLAGHPQGLSEPQAVVWLHGICAGVHYLHEHGIVHRDVKPGNLFIENGVVKVGDYGLAKFISASQRSGQTVSIGSVHYMAPEMSHGRYGKEVDQYAVGVILCQLLTGKVPFDGESQGEILMKHLTAEPDLGSLTEPYRSVVARLLDKDPQKRYAAMHDLLAELPAPDPDLTGIFHATGDVSAPAGQPAIPGLASKWERPAAPAPVHWTVLFRSDDPSVWDTDSKREKKFAIPLEKASEDIRYLRLRRMDTKEALILPITNDQLRNGKPPTKEVGAWWNGTAKEDWKGRHLGIAEAPRQKFPAPKGTISVMTEGWDDFGGSGFGHKCFVNDKQYYCWRGEEIPKTVFEIAVTDGPLTAEEKRSLVKKR
jgi:serine/threonine protein kinase